MAIVKSEFALALNQVASERDVSAEDVLSSIKEAVLSAFYKEHPEFSEKDIHVKVNRNSGEARIFEGETDITPPGFGRIAAQTARQIILQKIREVEKKTVLSQYKDQVGTLIRGRIIRADNYNVYIDIGKTQAVMPKEEQIAREYYSPNTQMIFYIKKIAEDKFGNSRIILSRNDNNLLSQLFKREVPEIASGSVEIKNVVRTAGERSKISVANTQSGIDPVGACVGQRGLRVQTITNEVGGQEKIDIIHWNEDPKIYITSALSPAHIKEITVDTAEKKATVSVTTDQAPLAIGKSGINVNLASQLTGYLIDIVQIDAENNTTDEDAKRDNDTFSDSDTE